MKHEELVQPQLFRPKIAHFTGFQLVYSTGCHLFERNNYLDQSSKFLLTNWDRLNKENVRSLILWHKGILKVIFDTEFLIVPRVNWFYCYNFTNFMGKNIAVSRSIGYRTEKSVVTYIVIEKSGILYLNERKF